jgi:hypothetical protein
METFTLGVSIDKYTQKPTTEEYKEMVFKQNTLTTTELYNLIRNGYVFCQNFTRKTYMSSYTSSKNFASANILVFDIDHSPLSLEYVIKHLQIAPTISYETFRNSPEDYRFRLLYLLNEPINSVEEYKRISELLFKWITKSSELKPLQSYIDSSCFSAAQLFIGTGLDQCVVSGDTIISTDFLSGISSQTLSDNKLSVDTSTKDLKSCNYSTTSNVCPKNENQFQINIPQYDLDMNYTFGTPNKNLIYPVNPFNNFFSADITDKNMIYHYVGDQNIYSLSTYMKNGKVEVGKRHNTMKYHMFVIRNMYPNITTTEIVGRIRWLVNAYYANPHEITDNEIYRMSGSIMKMDIKTDTGKRKYILNPDYKYLSKSEKIKSFQKCKSERTKDMILANTDVNKSYSELSVELGYSTATIKKYLKAEGIDIVKLKAEEKFEKFKGIYSQPENQGRSIRALAELCGVSKSQVSRYLKHIKE